MIWLMRYACWISKAIRERTHAKVPANTHARTCAHTDVILLFHGNNVFVNAPWLNVICTLPVLFPDRFFDNAILIFTLTFLSILLSSVFPGCFRCSFSRSTLCLAAARSNFRSLFRISYRGFHIVT